MPLHPFDHALHTLDTVKTKYSLDISGVAGFFGGDVAVHAMGTVHIYRGRKWLGWYNSPGSYEIAKSYGVICKSRLWDGLYPGVNVDPARLFELDGKEGPAFRGVQSGTVMAKTGHLGYLLSNECADVTVPGDHVAQGRKSSPSSVTVVNLHHVPEPTIAHPALSIEISTFLAFLPIIVTLLTCIMCVFVADDWFCFGLILYGAVASGLSCLAIGSGDLEVHHPTASEGAPRGDGILNGGGADIVVLLGEEGAVNTITRGAFSLHFNGEPQYNTIGACSLLLTIQFLAQLLIIPLGTLFGQLMFLASLFVSWIYTAYLSSIDSESLQRKIVNDKVLERQTKDKYLFGTRTAMSVFVLLVLRSRFASATPPSAASPSPTTPYATSSADVQAALTKVLTELLPNETPVWSVWKTVVLPCIVSGEGAIPSTNSFVGNDRTLFENLCRDAQSAIDLFRACKLDSAGTKERDSSST